MALCPERQRFESLQKKKRIERAESCTDIAKLFHTRTDDEGNIAELTLGTEDVPEVEIVIAGTRFREDGKIAAAPIELSGIDDNAAYGSSVPADPFCRRVNNDVCTMGNRIKKVSSLSERIIDDKRNSVRMSCFCNRLEIRNVKPGISDGLHINRFCFAVD